MVTSQMLSRDACARMRQKDANESMSTANLNCLQLIAIGINQFQLKGPLAKKLFINSRYVEIMAKGEAIASFPFVQLLTFVVCC